MTTAVTLSGSFAGNSSLLVKLTLVDGAQQPLRDDTPLHISVTTPFGEQVERDVRGSSHEFSLPYHGNARADVEVAITAKGFEPLTDTLPALICRSTQQATLMLLPARHRIQVAPWEALGSELQRVLAADIAAADHRRNYERLAFEAPDALANVLAVLTFMADQSQGESAPIGRVCALDWTAPMTSSELTLWVAVQAPDFQQRTANKLLAPTSFEPPRHEASNVRYASWQSIEPDRSASIAGTSCVRLQVTSQRKLTAQSFSIFWQYASRYGQDRAVPFAIVARIQPTFFEAAEDGNIPALKTFLASGVQVDALQKGRTALSIAVSNGRLEAVRFLLGAGANPSHAFSRSIERGAPEIVKTLLDAGAKPYQYKNWFPDLEAAVKNGHTDIVRLFLERGAQPAQIIDGKTSAFALAVTSGSESLVRLMLAHGADPNLLVHDNEEHDVEEKKHPILISAIANDRDVIAGILLEAGADARAQQNLPLTSAVKQGNATITDMLLKRGADPNASDGKLPAVVIATVVGNEDLVQVLLKGKVSQANLDLALLAASFFGHVELLDPLLTHGAQPNPADSAATALAFAAREGTPEAVARLLQAGANPSLRAGRLTPHEIAKQHGNHAAVQVLDGWNRGVHQPRLGRDFTYKTMGQNPQALRRELLAAFMFNHLALLELPNEDNRSLGLSIEDQERLTHELQFLLDSVVSVYQRKRGQVLRQMKVEAPRRPRVTVEVTDEPVAWAGTTTATPDKIIFTTKLLRANLEASTRSLLETPYTASIAQQVEQIRSLRRKVRLHVGTTFDPNNLGAAITRLVTIGRGPSDEERAARRAYGDLVELAQTIKPVETQYYGTLLFILAHELGHIVLNHAGQLGLPGVSRASLELQADEFAALLLGTGLIAQSVDSVIISIIGPSVRRLMYIDEEILDRYVGFSTFFGASYERAHFDADAESHGYPSVEERIKTTRAAVEAVRRSEGDRITKLAQTRYLFYDTAYVSFATRFGLLSGLGR